MIKNDGSFSAKVKDGENAYLDHSLRFPSEVTLHTIPMGILLALSFHIFRCLCGVRWLPQSQKEGSYLARTHNTITVLPFPHL